MSKDSSVYAEKYESLTEWSNIFIRELSSIVKSTVASDRQVNNVIVLLEKEVRQIQGEIIISMKLYPKKEIDDKEYHNTIVEVIKFYQGRLLTVIELLGLEDSNAALRNTTVTCIWRYAKQISQTLIGSHDFKNNPF